MTTRRDAAPVPRLGDKSAIFLFMLTLIAFVVESQLTQYVQTTLHYRQPFFIFYLVHSSLLIMFPLHILYITATTDYSAYALYKGLSIAIINHLSPQETSVPSKFPLPHFLRLVFALTVGITFPALLWFVAVSLASISDVTAIWNTNAFFAYLITLRLLRLKLEPRRLFTVSLATLGVLAVVYGGSTSSDGGNQSLDQALHKPRTSLLKPSAPLVGDLLTLVASIGYGLYQVLYKKYAALPSDLAAYLVYERILGEEPTIESYNTSSFPDSRDVVYPPPFGLHPNLLTSVIGLCTLVAFWIPIPVLNYLDIEPFKYPGDATTVFAIAGIALSGVVFNAGFMILLGIWGPIITSVGNLLTIVLVFVSDMLFGSGVDTITVWSLVGSSVIVAAFSVLAYDMYSRGQSV